MLAPRETAISILIMRKVSMTTNTRRDAIRVKVIVYHLYWFVQIGLIGNELRPQVPAISGPLKSNVIIASLQVICKYLVHPKVSNYVISLRRRQGD